MKTWSGGRTPRCLFDERCVRALIVVDDYSGERFADLKVRSRYLRSSRRFHLPQRIL
jgi:hypothetical protein